MLEFGRLIERLSPRQGWATYGILLAMLLVMGAMIADTNWTETPGLLWILFWSSLSGLLLSRPRMKWPVLHLAGLAIGFVVVVWQTSSLVPDQALHNQVQETWRRLFDWYHALTSDEISRDLLPFSMGILTGAWILGYFASWFLFRLNNVWVAVVVSGVALLTNLSFLPNVFSTGFFVFLLLAMVLIVRTSIVQRHEEWKKAGVEFTTTTGWWTLHWTAWLSVVVLLIAGLLPMRAYVSRTVADLWIAGRSPVQSLEDGFAQLFSSVPARMDLSGRYFGKTLPFLGPVAFGGEVVFWADSDYPSYWLSQTYSRYTSEGWIAGDTKKLDIGPNALPPPPQESLSRVPVAQNLRLNFDTSSLFSGGNLNWIDRSAVVETLDPMKFDIDLLDPAANAEYPPEIQELARQIGGIIASTQDDLVESAIARSLPQDLVLTSLTYGGLPVEGKRIIAAAVERKDPLTPHIVSYKFSDRVREDGAYSMVSYVSTADDEDLRKAGTEYPSLVRDHYLQLPADLPGRIRELAAELTRGAETPLDKAVAIEDYLRGPTFTYEQDIDAPPIGSDGVDHFLFETKTGYSDYFASSMAVLLRSAGVPARLAAGYAPGTYDPEVGARAIRDSDSHGWVQVYFPKYGWIDFEPTPSWPEHERVIEDPALRAAGGGAQIEGDELPLDNVFLPANLALIGFGSEGTAGERPSRWSSNLIWIPLAVALGALLAIAATIRLFWYAGMGSLSPIERMYTKMSRLGSAAGIGRMDHQTPADYANALGSAVPSVGAAARSVASAFAAGRYGRPTPGQEPGEGLHEAWQEVRGGLVSTVLRRLWPFQHDEQPGASPA